MANDLKNVQGSHVVLAADFSKDNEQEDEGVNGANLSNFLEALLKTDLINGVERIMLVTGSKQCI